MPPIKAIFFDIDNTLFDQDRAHKKALKRIAESHKDIFDGVSEEKVINAFLEADKKALEEFHNGSPLDAIRLEQQRRILEILGLDEKFAEEMMRTFYAIYPQINAPIDHAETVVRTLRGRYTVGVISNGSREVQHRKLNALGLTKLFQSIVVSEELGIRKPDPHIFWKALESFDVEPEESLYVGDSYHADVHGAKKAGMVACWFNPHKEQKEGEIEPDFEIHSLQKLTKLLQ